jgi:hypothetical protein
MLMNQGTAWIDPLGKQYGNNKITSSLQHPTQHNKGPSLFKYLVSVYENKP